MGSGVGGSGRGGGVSARSVSGVFNSRSEARSALPVGTTVSVLRRDGVETFTVVGYQSLGSRTIVNVERDRSNRFQPPGNRRTGLEAVLIGARINGYRVRIN